MTIGQAIKVTANALCEQGVENPEFDAKQLVAHALGVFPAKLPLIKTEEIQNEETLKNLTAERISGRPLQYILGAWEFYSLPISVREGVLIPRPETELLVDKALEFIKAHNVSKIVDLCCGSGCIAIAVGKNAPQTEIEAIDLYDTPIEVTVQNIGQCMCDNITVTRADILEGAGARELDLILSNPPYITEKDMKTLSKEVKNEPETALFGGKDGLTFYRAIAEKWVPALNRGGAVMLEIGIGQAQPVAELLKAAGLNKIEIHKDLNGIQRLVTGTKL